MLELWTKTLGGGRIPPLPPGLDRFKDTPLRHIFTGHTSSLHFDVLPWQQNYKRYLEKFDSIENLIIQSSSIGHGGTGAKFSKFGKLYILKIP